MNKQTILIPLLSATLLPANPAVADNEVAVTKRLLWANAPVLIDAESAKSPRRTYQIWERNVYPIGNGRLERTARRGRTARA